MITWRRRRWQTLERIGPGGEDMTVSCEHACTRRWLHTYRLCHLQYLWWLCSPALFVSILVVNGFLNKKGLGSTCLVWLVLVYWVQNGIVLVTWPTMMTGQL